MLLSEAIRLGAMLKPQGYGPVSVNPARDATCALGAAGAALGFQGHIKIYLKLVATYPWTLTVLTCPVCESLYIAPVVTMITHLNDYHRWTRERIADWVEQIERQLPENAPACAAKAPAGGREQETPCLTAN